MVISQHDLNRIKHLRIVLIEAHSKILEAAKIQYQTVMFVYFHSIIRGFHAKLSEKRIVESVQFEFFFKNLFKL